VRARQLKLMDLLSTWDRWYWMPDFLIVFSDFGKKTTDYYELIKLSPAYRVYFVDEFIAIADNLPEIEATLRI
jgi:phytoene desaturase